MRRILLFGPVVVLVLVLNLVGAGSGARAVAQESTPVAGCEGPELPPGTPTPMEDAASPAADHAEGEDHEATPTGDEAAEGEEESFEMATPEGVMPAAEADAATAIAGMENVIACFDTGDYPAAGALMTDRFIQEFLGIPTVYDVPANLEGAAPFEVVSLDNAQTYADGSYSVDFIYSGFFNGPCGITAERWFLVDEGGYLKVDNITQISLPEGALPGALVVDVTMVDYAFALSQTTLPADTPIIFRLTNATSSGAPHVGVVLTFEAGTTAEAVISSETEIGEPTGFFGALYLEAGDSGEFGVTGLAAGTYFLACDVETEAGNPHYELGMVSEITVE